MARTINPQKRKFPLRFKHPALLPTDRIRLQSLRLKLLCTGELNGVSDSLAAEPVTDEICVAGPDDGLDGSRGDDGGELGEEGARVIPRRGELVVDVIRAFLVGGFGADGFHDRGLFQVGGVGGGGVRVLRGFADVVDVEVVGGFAAVGAGLGEWVFDLVGAGLVAALTVGVGAAGVALVEGGAAVFVEGVHEVGGLGCRDEWFVGVVQGEVDVFGFLEGGVEPAVVDTEGDELDLFALDTAGRNGRVLGFDVACKLHIMHTSAVIIPRPDPPIFMTTLEGLPRDHSVHRKIR